MSEQTEIKATEPTILYSKETGGFFRSDIHTQIPADAVEVSLREYQMLMNAQSHGGKAIAGGPDGRPVLVANNLNMKMDVAGAKAMLTASVRGITKDYATQNAFSSVEEACSILDGKYAAEGVRFRALRDGMREALLDQISKFEEDEEVSMETIQGIVSFLQATAKQIMGGQDGN